MYIGKYAPIRRCNGSWPMDLMWPQQTEATIPDLQQKNCAFKTCSFWQLLRSSGKLQCVCGLRCGQVFPFETRHQCETQVSFNDLLFSSKKSRWVSLRWFWNQLFPLWDKAGTRKSNSLLLKSASWYHIGGSMWLLIAKNNFCVNKKKSIVLIKLLVLVLN